MADDDDGPAVELGDGKSVEGAPLARVASRLTWGMPTSELREREGETVIRTPDGPQTLGDVLEAIDVPYFESRREFVGAVEDAVGTGPVPTADE